MKKFIVYFFLCLCFFVCGCGESEMNPMSPSNGVSKLSKLYTSSVNLSNPYDVVGQAYYSLYDTYYSAKHDLSTVEAVVDTLTVMAVQDSVFVSLAPASYQFTAQTDVVAILSCDTICQDALLTTCFVSASTRNGFKAFLEDYVLLCEGSSDYSSIHNYVVAYENSILGDTLLSLPEKRLLMIATSIARHTAHAKKKKPKKNTDPEWTLLVTNLYGALDGGMRSDADAVIEALAVGILINK